MEKFKIIINNPEKAWEVAKNTEMFYMDGLTKEEALRKAVLQYQESLKSN